MTTLTEALARVDDEQQRVIWLVETDDDARRTIEWIRAHHQVKGQSRTIIGRRNEQYQHVAGGWLRILAVPLAHIQLRFMRADLIVAPAGYLLPPLLQHSIEERLRAGAVLGRSGGSTLTSEESG